MGDKPQAQVVGGRPQTPDGRDTGAPRDGGLWRGPSEAHWIVQLLHGAPPPRDSARRLDGLVAHG